jgi:hypothetical protein
MISFNVNIVVGLKLANLIAALSQILYGSVTQLTYWLGKPVENRTFIFEYDFYG